MFSVKFRNPCSYILTEILETITFQSRQILSMTAGILWFRRTEYGY